MQVSIYFVKDCSAVNYSYLNLKILPVFYVEFLTRRTQFKQYRMRQLIAFDEGERMLILSLRVITRVSRVWLYEMLRFIVLSTP